MSAEIASDRRAPGLRGAHHDEDGIDLNSDVLCNVAHDRSPGRCQVETRDTHGESGEQVDPPIPAMEDGKAGSYLRNKLKHSAESYPGREQEMPGKDTIPDGVAGDISVGENFVPRQQIPSNRRTTVKRCDIHDEDQLTGDGHHKPKGGCRFQGGVRNGIHPQPIGRYSRVHGRCSLANMTTCSGCRDGGPRRGRTVVKNEAGSEHQQRAHQDGTAPTPGYFTRGATGARLGLAPPSASPSHVEGLGGRATSLSDAPSHVHVAYSGTGSVVTLAGATV